jgi:Ricin-type beta-trefoil lectin domain
MIGSRIRRAVVAGLLALGVGVAVLVAATPAQAFVPRAQGWGAVYNLASPRCLDLGTTANAQLRSCTGSSRQYWTWKLNGTIVNSAVGGCLDDGAGFVGSPVAVRACSGSSHQSWYDNGISGLVNVASGLCLDADAGTINQENTFVQVWSCNGQSNQYWYFQYVPQ